METITITREQFNDAVMKANDKFKEIGSKKDADAKNDMVNLMMGLQNTVFGSLLGSVLFEDE